MKLIKPKKLTEADLNTAPIEDVSVTATTDIADAVKKDIEAESDGDVVLTNKEAEATAQDIKDVDKKIENSVFIPTISENELTRALDRALHFSLRAKRQAAQRNSEKFEGSNVLVTGLPGSGKTAIVYNWAAHNNVNIMYLDAKNNDLEAYINGYTLKDATKPDQNIITQGYSDNLDPLDRENSILFLDELNRQTKANIRGSLYSLINEHVIAGKDDEGRRFFPNLLFTIACINPSVPSDKGASPLSDAELSRFSIKIPFDSNTEAAVDYFTKHYNDLVKTLDRADTYFKDDYKEYQMEKELALFITTNKKFKFDDRDDLDDLAGDYAHPKSMLNLRSLSQAISMSNGTKNDFLKYIDKYSDFLEKDKDMLHDILASYTDPVITIGSAADTSTGAAPKTSGADDWESDDFDFNGIDDDDEIDISLLGTGTSKVRFSDTPAAAASKIKSFTF